MTPRPNPKKVKDRSLVIGLDDTKEKPKKPRNYRKEEPDFATKASRNSHSTQRKEVDEKRRLKQIEKEEALKIAQKLQDDAEHVKYLRSLDSYQDSDIDAIGNYKPRKNRKISSYQDIDLKLLAYYARIGYSTAWLAEQFNCSVETLYNLPYSRIIKTAHNNLKTAILTKTSEMALQGSANHTKIIIDKFEAFNAAEAATQPIEIHIKWE